MNYDIVILQLKAAAPFFAGNVAGAADFEAGIADQVWLPTPAAYVVPGTVGADGNDEFNGVYQTFTEQVEVFVQFDNRADRRGQSVTALYEAAFAALCKALLGWNPDPGRHQKGFMFVGGDRVDQDRARLFYRWTFAIPSTLSDCDGWLPGDPDVTGQQGIPPVTVIDATTDLGDPPIAVRVTLPQE